MTERQHNRAPARAALTAVIAAAGALAMAGQAGADPAVPGPTPTPAVPGAATPAPGQSAAAAVEAAVALPAPPPVGAPPVPEIQNPAYGRGQSPGQLGYLRDMWHTFNSGNPLDAFMAPPEQALGAPPGAGPPPKLPPGFVSLTAPESSTGSMPGFAPGPLPGAAQAPVPAPDAAEPPMTESPTMVP